MEEVARARAVQEAVAAQEVGAAVTAPEAGEATATQEAGVAAARAAAGATAEGRKDGPQKAAKAGEAQAQNGAEKRTSAMAKVTMLPA